MVNRKLLKSKMELFGDRNEDLANAIGISPQRFSLKLNGSNGADFNVREINQIKVRYNLTIQEVDSIFFESNVSCEDTTKGDAVRDIQQNTIKNNHG